jgi:hypothetical protein
MPDESRLTVTFGGSCGFIEHLDGSRVRVLLPKRGGGWQASDPEVIVPPHRAFIKFRMAYHNPIETFPRIPDFVYLDGVDPVGICFLEEETLTLPKGLDTPLFINPSPIGNKAKPGPVDARSFDWVASIDAICERPDVDKTFLGAALPDSIAARIDITAGVLETELVPADQFAFDPEPDHPKAPYQQCLAGMVRASCMISGIAATIASSSKDGLRLRALDSEIKLGIFNEVLDDIILTSKFHRPALYKDFDFEMLYDLTKAGDAHVHLPRDTRLGIGGKRSGTSGDCKPGRFAKANFDYPKEP